MNKPLEVDAFEIDIEALAKARYSNNRFARGQANWQLVEAMIKALDIDSKKRFEEYQEQNDPCR